MTNAELQDKNTDSIMSPDSVHSHVLRVGEVVILLTTPESKLRGFVGVLTNIDKGSCQVRLLDSVDTVLKLVSTELITTGRKPQDLVEQYVVTDLSLSQAVDLERSLPDFDLMKAKPKSKSSTKATKTPKSKQSLGQLIKGLSPEQLKALGALLINQAKETKI
jgi:hypothetical protein